MNYQYIIAQRGHWKTEPFSENVHALPLELVLEERQFKTLQYGLIPQQMEDKWFVFYEKDCFYFHRSWTGCLIFQLKFERREEYYVCVECWVERDTDIYMQTDDMEDMAFIRRMVFFLANRDPQIE